jgi:hypothetical protein
MPSPPINLVSVNKTPARAASLVDQLLKTLELDSDIVHVANALSKLKSVRSRKLSLTQRQAIENLPTVLDALVTPARILVSSISI